MTSAACAASTRRFLRNAYGHKERVFMITRDEDPEHPRDHSRPEDRRRLTSNNRLPGPATETQSIVLAVPDGHPGDSRFPLRGTLAAVHPQQPPQGHVSLVLQDPSHIKLLRAVLSQIMRLMQPRAPISGTTRYATQTRPERREGRPPLGQTHRTGLLRRLRLLRVSLVVLLEIAAVPGLPSVGMPMLRVPANPKAGKR